MGGLQIITSQIREEIKKVSLPSAWVDACVQELEKERRLTCQFQKPWCIARKWHMVSLGDRQNSVISGKSINWRREGDSNPRYAINVYTLSRRALSTTQPPLRCEY